MLSLHDARMSRLQILRAGAMLGVALIIVVQTPVSARAPTPTDPTDAPSGIEGKTDLRSLEWTTGRGTTSQTVSVDASQYRINEQRARLGLHVLVDTDSDGLADVEVAGARNVDGESMDMTLRSLARTQSTGDCQDLAGTTTFATTALTTTTQGGLESVAFTFDNAQVPGGLSQFRWVAFGQSPGADPAGGPWDYLPDAANPDPTVSNPGSRACATGGLRVRVAAGIDVPVGSTFPQTRTDSSDAPAGPEGKTDLRSVTWDVSATTTTLTLAVDDSRYGIDVRAALGLRVLLDTDRDGLANAAITGIRNADGTSIDMTLRLLGPDLSTADCQNLAGSNIVAQGTVVSSIANGLETFTFAFDTGAIPGGLSRARWAAFGQSPEDAASAGPWDYFPDAANPDPTATNPGDRRCGSGLEGIRLNMAPSLDLKGTKPASSRP
jgi:hypothetical protein